MSPPVVGNGTYTVNDDCSGILQFLDAANLTFRIHVDPPRGNTIWLIQTNPANNVFQGNAKRVR